MPYRFISFVLVSALALSAGPGGGMSRVPQGTEPPEQLRNVGIEQHLDQQLPLDAEFLDEKGNKIRLGQLFGQRPAVLALVYYECPMLCTMVLNGLLRSARTLKLDVGKDFDVIAISFDPTETPQLADKKKFEYTERYGREGSEAGWHFLTGKYADIQKVTEAAGFRYAQDPKTGQWAHASAIMVVTPGGKLSQYHYGVEYSARDLRLALVEASKGHIGTFADQVLLYCFHYDPATGKYSLFIMNVLRGAGLATVGALLIFWFLQFRKERRRHHHVQFPIVS
ncbi:MAG: SCO family protein [Bryobacteraceae bacterium]